MALYANGNKVAPVIPAYKVEQSKTLTLGSATPQTVVPDSGKVLSSVPVSLDTSIIKAENIAKDVVMLGITGTHEGGTARLKDISPITANGTYKVLDDLILVDKFTCTGGGYFATDIVLPDISNTSTVRLFEFVFVPASGVYGNKYIFGADGTTGKIVFGYTNTYRQFINGFRDVSGSDTFTAGVEITAISSTSGITINGTASSGSGTTYATGLNTLDILGYNSSGGHTGYFKGDFKYLKIKDVDGTLLYDFVPARNANNEPLLLDKVAMKTYAYTGTGLTLGTDVSDESYDGFKSPLVVNAGNKYNITIDGMLGDINSSGDYVIPTATINPTFTGVVSLPSNALQYRFYGQSNIGVVSFPNLTTVGQNALLYACTKSGATSFSAPNLTTVNANGMQYTFNSCSNMRGEITLNSLTTIGSYGLYSTFYNCYYITKFNATSLTKVSSYGMYGAFYGVLEMTELNIPNITTINGGSAFYTMCSGCNKLTTVNMTIPDNTYTYLLYSAFQGCLSLTTPPTINITDLKGYVMYRCFYNCTSLPSFTFPELLTISGGTSLSYCFYNCTSLTNVTFTKLTQISSYAALNYCFQKCTGGLNVYFPALTTLSSGQTFQNTWNGANGANVYFPALTVAGFGSSKTHFSNACTGATGVTFHFPAAVQSTVEALTNYPNFGGTGTTVLFDL